MNEPSAARPRRPVPAVLADVVRDDKVLLVRRANPPDAGFWGFPGGKIELGEPIAAAALRELYEETGIRAVAGRVLTALDSIHAGDGRVAHHYVMVAVLCAWVGGEAVAADDALEAGWFDLAALGSADLRKSRDVETVAAAALASTGQGAST